MKRKILLNLIYLPLFLCVLFLSDSMVYAADTQTIQLNQEISDSLTTNSDENWYTFTLEESGVLSLEFFHETINSESWSITLYDKNSLPVFSSYNDKTKLVSPSYGLSEGSYSIKITCPYQYSTYTKQTYHLKVSFTITDTWEQEGNNVSSDANAIKVNKLYSGNLYNNQDEDWFSFAPSKNGCFSFDFLHEAAEADSWSITLYDSAMSPIKSFYSSAATDSTSCYGISSGTYYVHVTCPYKYTTYTSQTYSIRVNFKVSAAYESESNNSFSTADVIKTGKAYTGNLYVNSDIDYYKFTVSANGSFSFQFLNAYEDRHAWKITLYKKDKTPIFSYYNRNTALTSTKIGLAKGTYYFSVCCPYQYTTYSDASYQMKFTFKKSSYWESEGNGSLRTADTIKLTKRTSSVTGYIYGNSSSNTDKDYYTFMVSKKGQTTITFSHSVSENVTWKILIYNKKGKKITELNNQTKSSSKTITLSPGTYYVKVVTSSSTYSWTPYKVSIKTK
ncbi:T9SS type A sorting domain-containing protein [Anaeromicropila populeti]|uniref:Por secretion system C-terminal sorting domain-containing protein n=1 Tax=Anaeromicropila populeti TaxID=37658 RepID=A0A1I6HY29_9FIRM|nr:T9SS type A sorting domain-containing protein [Anaeromicropila populeti]SFR59120.1 Por secretion system C-terminal sorting domain-containing protein [Anaeromicropila populeti]